MQAHQQIIRDDEKKNTEHIRWLEVSKSGQIGWWQSRKLKYRLCVKLNTSPRQPYHPQCIFSYVILSLPLFFPLQISGSPEFNDVTKGEGIRKASSNMQ